MRTIVFDIETQKEFAEVGGPQNRHLLGIALIGCYDSASGEFRAFLEPEVPAFAKLLQQADLVIGFNVKHFDLPVLQPYIPLDTAKLPVLDLMEDLERMLGHRISLDACASATLGAKKTGHGLEAIQWFRQGKIELVREYCLNDVRLTRDLYEYGRTHGEVHYLDKTGERRTVPVTWGEHAVDRARIRAIITTAFRDRRRVEIEYVTMRSKGDHERNRRTIDIIRINGDTVEAYCHLRRDTRRFDVDRITDVRVLEEVTNPGLAVGQPALL